MVSSKFRICAFEGRVSVSLGLLDPGDGQVRQRCRTTSKPHRGEMVWQQELPVAMCFLSLIVL